MSFSFKRHLPPFHLSPYPSASDSPQDATSFLAASKFVVTVVINVVSNEAKVTACSRFEASVDVSNSSTSGGTWDWTVVTLRKGFYKNYVLCSVFRLTKHRTGILSQSRIFYTSSSPEHSPLFRCDEMMFNLSQFVHFDGDDLCHDGFVRFLYRSDLLPVKTIFFYLKSN